MEKELELSSDASKTMVGGVPKNFRQQADMEAFYRFVYDNDLRLEALAILDTIRAQKSVAKAAKRAKH